MKSKAMNLIKKHFFYDEPHCGDHLNVCKICEVGNAIEELQNRGEK